MSSAVACARIEEAEYRELAGAAAVRGAERNGVRLRARDVSFGGTGFAPTRVTVRVRGEARVRTGSAPEAVGRIPRCLRFGTSGSINGGSKRRG